MLYLRQRSCLLNSCPQKVGVGVGREMIFDLAMATLAHGIAERIVGQEHG